MAYSIFIRLWSLIPRRLLVALVAAILIYLLGISHGREPYKLAAKINAAKTEVTVKHVEFVEKHANKEERQLNENFKNYNCVIGDDVGNRLSEDGAN
ncbi:MAG: hypothetical protein HRU28_05585 [Rhizobiales bacterium]|nr:hypothetical protein [Hyphomicrobiales bacterium]